MDTTATVRRNYPKMVSYIEHCLNNHSQRRITSPSFDTVSKANHAMVELTIRLMRQFMTSLLYVQYEKVALDAFQEALRLDEVGKTTDEAPLDITIRNYIAFRDILATAQSTTSLVKSPSAQYIVAGPTTVNIVASHSTQHDTDIVSIEIKDSRNPHRTVTAAGQRDRHNPQFLNMAPDSILGAHLSGGLLYMTLEWLSRLGYRGLPVTNHNAAFTYTSGYYIQDLLKEYPTTAAADMVFYGGRHKKVTDIPGLDDRMIADIPDQPTFNPSTSFAAMIRHPSTSAWMMYPDLLSSKEIFELGVATPDGPLTEDTLPDIYRFSNIRDVKQAFDNALGIPSEIATETKFCFGREWLSAKGQYILSFLNEAIVNGRLFPSLKAEDRPNFIVYDTLDSKDGRHRTQLMFYRVESFNKD